MAGEPVVCAAVEPRMLGVPCVSLARGCLARNGTKPEVLNGGICGQIQGTQCPFAKTSGILQAGGASCISLTWYE